MKTSTVVLLGAGAAIGFALLRVHGAKDAGIPLDLTFKHLFTSPIELRRAMDMQGEASVRRAQQLVK